MRRRRRSWGEPRVPVMHDKVVLPPFVRLPCVGGLLDGLMMGFRPPVPAVVRVGGYSYFLVARRTPRGSWLISFFERGELRAKP